MYFCVLMILSATRVPSPQPHPELGSTVGSIKFRLPDVFGVCAQAPYSYVVFVCVCVVCRNGMFFFSFQINLLSHQPPARGVFLRNWRNTPLVARMAHFLPRNVNGSCLRWLYPFRDNHNFPPGLQEDFGRQRWNREL